MRDKVTIVLFTSIILIIMIVTMIMPKKEFSARENRYLESKPEIQPEAILDGEYQKNYESYINDQFVGRDIMMQLSSYTRMILGIKEINGVYLGRNGYLIEKHDKEEFEADNALKNGKYLAEFVKEYSEIAKCCIILVPTSSEILSDKLPSHAKPYSQQTYIDKVYQAVEDINQDMADRTIDASHALKEHSGEEIYYRTDHHYTQLGAYYVYRSWAEGIGLNVRKLSDYKVSEVTGNFYGTLDSKTHLAKKGDTICIYESKEDIELTIKCNEGEETNDSLYDYNALKKRDKYSVFLGGNNPILQITTDADSNRRILVVKDSFAHSFIPFMVNDFSQIDVVDIRYYNKSIKELIASGNYTDILVLYNAPGFALDANIHKLLE